MCCRLKKKNKNALYLMKVTGACKTTTKLKKDIQWLMQWGEWVPISFCDFANVLFHVSHSVTEKCLIPRYLLAYQGARSPLYPLPTLVAQENRYRDMSSSQIDSADCCWWWWWWWWTNYYRVIKSKQLQGHVTVRCVTQKCQCSNNWICIAWYTRLFWSLISQIAQVDRSE